MELPIDFLSKLDITNILAMAAMFWFFYSRLDKKFANIDRNFEAMDRKFEVIDRKFEEIGKKFEETNLKISELDKKFTTSISELEKLQILTQSLSWIKDLQLQFLN